MENSGSEAFKIDVFLKTISPGAKTVVCREGDILYSQGDLADAVFYIAEGKVKLTVVSTQGKEAIVGVLDVGAFFGEACLTARMRRMATASALLDSQLVRMEKAAMLLALDEDPRFSHYFMSYLLRRSIRIEEDLVDQLFNSSEKRLARLLLLLANFGKEGKTETITPKISQEMLAEMIGTTRSRVSFFMNKFRDLGFIDYNGGLRVHNSLLSVVLLDGRSDPDPTS